MAKNDYHVIVGYILLYLYTCLQKGKSPENDVLSLAQYPDNIPDSYRDYVYIQLEEEGYIRGLMWGSVAALRIKPTRVLKSWENVQITPKGIDYLQNDKSMEKALKPAKELLNLLFSAIGAFK